MTFFIKTAAISGLIFSVTAFGSRPTETVRIFGNHTKPPKSYLFKGKPRGILCDILTEAGKIMNVTFEIKLYPWNRSFNLADTGQGGIIGFSKSPQRLEKFDYSDPVYYDEVLIGVKKGKEFKFSSLSDLKGKHFAILKGGSYGMKFENALRSGIIEITPVNSHRKLYELILKSRVDGGLVGPGKAGVRSQLESLKLPEMTIDKLSFLKQPFNNDPNFLGFSKKMKKKNFLKRFNQALSSLKSDGVIKKILQRYEKTDGATP